MPAAKRKPKGQPPPAIAKWRPPREAPNRPTPEQFARMAARAGKGGKIIGARPTAPRPKQGQR